MAGQLQRQSRKGADRVRRGAIRQHGHVTNVQPGVAAHHEILIHHRRAAEVVAVQARRGRHAQRPDGVVHRAIAKPSPVFAEVANWRSRRAVFPELREDLEYQVVEHGKDLIVRLRPPRQRLESVLRQVVHPVQVLELYVRDVGFGQIDDIGVVEEIAEAELDFDN